MTIQSYDNRDMQTSAATPAPRVIDRFFEFSMLGMLATGYLAVLGTHTLDWPTAVLAFAALFTRALMAAGLVRVRLEARVTTALAFLYFAFFPVDLYYVSHSFLAAIVHMIVFLGGLKLLTAATPRDFGYLKLLAMLELIAAAMLSANLAFLLYLGMFVLFGILALTSGEVRRASQQAEVSTSQSGMRTYPRRLAVLSASLLLGVCVLTVGLFLRALAQPRHEIDELLARRVAGDSDERLFPSVARQPSRVAGLISVRLGGASFDRRGGYGRPQRRREAPPDGEAQARLLVCGEPLQQPPQGRLADFGAEIAEQRQHGPAFADLSDCGGDLPGDAGAARASTR